MNYFQILNGLHNIYNKFENRTVDRTSIVRQIKRTIPFKECSLYSLETLSIPNGKFNVSGLYDPDQDEQGKPAIVIEIAFPKKKTFTFNEFDLRREHWAELCIDLASTLGHEFVHLNQFRRREYRWNKKYKSKTSDFRQKEIQEYYGDTDEIGAYAFVAAAEMILSNISNPENHFDAYDTAVYQLYKKVFDDSDPALNKLTKLIKVYNKRLEKQYHATTFE